MSSLVRPKKTPQIQLPSNFLGIPEKPLWAPAECNYGTVQTSTIKYQQDIIQLRALIAKICRYNNQMLFLKTFITYGTSRNGNISKNINTLKNEMDSKDEKLSNVYDWVTEFYGQQKVSVFLSGNKIINNFICRFQSYEDMQDYFKNNNSYKADDETNAKNDQDNGDDNIKWQRAFNKRTANKQNKRIRKILDIINRNNVWSKFLGDTCEDCLKWQCVDFKSELDKNAEKKRLNKVKKMCNEFKKNHCSQEISQYTNGTLMDPLKFSQENQNKVVDAVISVVTRTHDKI